MTNGNKKKKPKIKFVIQTFCPNIEFQNENRKFIELLLPEWNVLFRKQIYVAP